MTDKPSNADPVVGAWASLGLFALVFTVIIVALKTAQGALMSHMTLDGPRAIAAFRASGSIVLDWVELLAMIVILRLRGQTLADIGWPKRASWRGWFAAFVATAIYVGFAAAGPMLKGAPLLTDWSVFRIATGLGVGITAGFCEEAMFRGFVMTQAQQGGAPLSVQVLLSAILFGAAHAGWGGIGAAHFSWGAAIGASVSTAILGLMLAITYALGRRSLLPVVAAHGIMDMILEPWLLLFAIGGGFARMGH
jgi:membrane protease YdiL (CAAX protease family)